MASNPLPKTQSALVQTTYAQPLEIKSIPVPDAIPGSAVIKILSTPVVSYAKEVYNGTRKYPYVTPIVPGSSAVGRVAALGPDSTSLKIGQLVHIDCTIHSRDNPDDIILCGLAGGFTEGSQKLMKDVWRDGTWAEYTRVPLEVVFPLNEEKLVGELGYKMSDLATLTRYLVPYGGLKDIGVQVGETVVVAPSTGGFGGAGVACAVAMGASVIAMGRTESKLKALVDTFGARVKTVKITENVEHDSKALTEAAGGPIDAVLEISPSEAAKSTLIKSCINALKRRGRVSFMGGIHEDVPIPIFLVMQKDLVLKGKWMYGRDEILALIKLVEAGMLKIGEKGGIGLKGEYGFVEWEEALDVAFENSRWDAFVVMRP
ncbi:GroES-like protein [Trematosphaeria pertusa]|uniref:alcohol dehydrogenase n=1 Tax=Trematosphaeria pertusa TaxID=390896 RepID=A0A6A6IND0_9PLEO|nr:GroES-like protein [Trematosphaeria pertusa]KAF2251747.1 GroES-like protein [Trematosphaeria pertusa]